mmetsp:Transcript_23762/g.65324  ORF Transcript_23762/g.65324 Transcript_23762/m.65324 type:complete len:260 (-) Transcript_23762:2317-3096(-)
MSASVCTSVLSVRNSSQSAAASPSTVSCPCSITRTCTIFSLSSSNRHTTRPSSASVSGVPAAAAPSSSSSSSAGRHTTSPSCTVRSPTFAAEYRVRLAALASFSPLPLHSMVRLATLAGFCGAAFLPLPAAAALLGPASAGFSFCCCFFFWARDCATRLAAVLFLALPASAFSSPASSSSSFSSSSTSFAGPSAAAPAASACFASCAATLLPKKVVVPHRLDHGGGSGRHGLCSQPRCSARAHGVGIARGLCNLQCLCL